MTDLMKITDNIKMTQQTIDAVLKSGKLKIKDNNLVAKEEKHWYVKGIYSDETCSIGFGVFPGGPNDEDSKSIAHIHQNSKECLILVRGAAALFVDGKFTRTLNVGDVGIINPGETHYSVPLKKDTKIVSVCIPADETYKHVFANVRTDNS